MVGQTHGAAYLRFRAAEYVMLQTDVQPRGPFKALLGEETIPFDHPDIIKTFRGDSAAPPWGGIAEAVITGVRSEVFPGRYPVDDSFEPIFREKCVQFFSTTCGIQDVSADNIVIGEGTGSILGRLYTIIAAPGDIVLAGIGHYHLHAVTAAMSNIEHVTIPSRGYKLLASDIEIWFSTQPELVTKKAKILLLYNPQPRTGAIYSRGELIDLAQIAVNYGLFIISDEIYRGTEYEKQRRVYSLASVTGIVDPCTGEEVRMIDRSATLWGPSKTFGCVGLRIGIACLPLHLVNNGDAVREIGKIWEVKGLDVLDKLANEGSLDTVQLSDYMSTRLGSSLNVPYFTQLGAAAAFDTPQELLELTKKECKIRLKLILQEYLPTANDILSKCGAGCSITPSCIPVSGFNIVLDFSGLKGLILPGKGQLLRDSFDLFVFFRSHGVGLSPGDSIGFTQGIYMMFGYAEIGHSLIAESDDPVEREPGFVAGRALLKEAWVRISNALAELMQINYPNTQVEIRSVTKAVEVPVKIEKMQPIVVSPEVKLRPKPDSPERNPRVIPQYNTARVLNSTHSTTTVVSKEESRILSPIVVATKKDNERETPQVIKNYSPQLAKTQLPITETVVDMFTKNVLETPNNLAIVDEHGGSMTFSELDFFTNRLCHILLL